MTATPTPPPDADAAAVEPGADHPIGHVTRRTVLGAGVGAAALHLLPVGAAGGWLAAPAAAEGLGGPSAPVAAASPGRLVVVFLRGGMDGLSAVAPVSDPRYHDLRPTIGLDEAKALGLDATFGMHPALAALRPLYDGGRLAFVHAVGNPAASRSHFDAQSYWEAGDDGPAPDGRGWLGRYLATTSGAPGAVARGVAINVTLTPSLRGSDALLVPSVSGYGREGLAALGRPAFTQLYADPAVPIQRRGRDALASVDAVGALPSTPVPGGTGTDAAAFGDLVALLAGGLGIEVATIDLGGWDTHNAMGTTDAGDMRNLLAGLGANLAGFQAALDARGLTDVTTVVMSEFGRRVQQNGSGGLDHGYGNLMAVMGAGVAGGRVVADWPGLQTLNQGDLDVTTDFRDVLWELVQERLGHPDPGQVFLGHAHTDLGLIA